MGGLRRLRLRAAALPPVVPPIRAVEVPRVSPSRLHACIRPDTQLPAEVHRRTSNAKRLRRSSLERLKRIDVAVFSKHLMMRHRAPNSAAGTSMDSTDIDSSHPSRSETGPASDTIPRRRADALLAPLTMKTNQDSSMRTPTETRNGMSRPIWSIAAISAHLSPCNVWASARWLLAFTAAVMTT